MEHLYTKNGRPLRLDGDRLFARSGRQVGKVRSGKVFGPDGRYVGTIIGDRVIYRSTQSASIGSSFAPSVRSPSGYANHAGSGRWGDEPPIPD